MKLALMLLVVLPLALSTPEKRFFMDDLAHLLNIDELKHTVQTIANNAGSDATEAACEAECKTVIHATIITEACPVICKSFQSLVKRFHITA